MSWSNVKHQMDQLEALRLKSGQLGKASRGTDIWEIWVHNKNIESSTKPQSKYEPCKFVPFGVDITTTQDFGLAMTLVTEETFGTNRELIFCKKEVTQEQLQPDSGFGRWIDYTATIEKRHLVPVVYFRDSCEAFVNNAFPNLLGTKIEKLPCGRLKVYHWVSH